MNKINGFPEESTLRRSAEEKLKEAAGGSKDLSEMPPEKIAGLIHELKVHQVELEMQNDELRRVQAELEKTSDKYSHLYDLAPIGYLTISDKGMILEANLTCASMLGIERRLLIGMPFSRFINRDDQDIFYLNRMKLIESQSRQIFELRIIKKDGKQFYAQLESIAMHISDSDQIHFRTAMSDISERREAREILDRNMAELNQRVKELNCLYKISKIREAPEIPLEEILQTVVDTLPPSWQYPDIACSRITFDRKEYKSKNFKETGWKQCTDIVVGNKPAGIAGIYYLKEMPERDEGPFLKEERSLINAVAERIGKIIEFKEMQKKLQTARDDLEKKVEERTADIARTNRLLEKEIVDRKKAEKILSENEMKLKKQAIHLEEMNTALNVLLEHREEERIKLEENIIANINRLVLPNLEKLGKGKLSADKRLYIEVIKSNIEEIISPFSVRLSSVDPALTPTELKVANFVKEGLTSKEIASMLNISHNTVMFHRKKIRNKLGLTNRKTNFRSYIKSLT